MGGIRELLGSGTILGFPITAGVVPPMTIMLLPPGGFFVFGMLVMAANKLSDRKARELDCNACPIAEACTVVCEEKAGDE
jgi:electron transport complex protein RnfE